MSLVGNNYRLSFFTASLTDTAGLLWGIITLNEPLSFVDVVRFFFPLAYKISRRMIVKRDDDSGVVVSTKGSPPSSPLARHRDAWLAGA